MVLRPFLVAFLGLFLLSLNANPVGSDGSDLAEIDLAVSFRCEAPFGVEPERVHLGHWLPNGEREIRLESEGRIGSLKRAVCDFQEISYTCEWGWGSRLVLDLAHPVVRAQGEGHFQLVLRGRVKLGWISKSQPVSCRLRAFTE